jgi:hypothetical protein
LASYSRNPAGFTRALVSKPKVFGLASPTGVSVTKKSSSGQIANSAAAATAYCRIGRDPQDLPDAASKSKSRFPDTYAF